MHRLLIPLLVIATSSVAQTAERTPDEWDKLAERLLEQAYRRTDVQTYCDANPSSVYVVEMGSDGRTVAVPVRCRAFHDWVELRTK